MALENEYLTEEKENIELKHYGFICMQCGKVEDAYILSSLERSCFSCGTLMKGYPK